MRCFFQSLRRASVLFCLGLLVIHCGESRVLTEMQTGPLYRVVGSELSIFCNVSGFGNDRKDFEFRMYSPRNPLLEINVISTGDQFFSYASFNSRVMSEEITLTHVTPNSVLFTIKHLQKHDEGDYECSVVNTASVYDGIYAAKITVKVIDNSLTVSSPATSVSHNEGDTLTLTCQASSNTVQHTHLSLAWYLHRDGEDQAHPVISLDRDFTLSPGRGFEGRCQAGLIRLDKVGDATYRLMMDKLEPSDQGKIYCQAQEWIQDPDRSWCSITQRDAEATTLYVKAKDMVSDKVNISAQQTELQKGQELSLSCSVDTQNMAERFFSVAWLREGVELARIGPTGVLSVGPQFSGRDKEGELRAARTGEREHRLILQPVSTQDQGEYMCRAWPQDRGADGTFTEGAALDSSSVSVTVSATESGLSVEMEQKNVSVNEGDRLELTCKVRGVKGRLSVTWQHKSASVDIITLSQEGVMEIGATFGERNITAVRPAPDTFTLVLNEVTQSDSGVYQCTVSEWTRNGKIHKNSSQSQTCKVAVAPIESFLKVYLTSRSPVVTVGDEVELVCCLRGQRRPVTLTWSLQRDASPPDTVLTLYSNGDINWSEDWRRYQVKTESYRNELRQTLLITGASQSEEGRYQCEASVFLEKRHKRIPPSHQLALMVNNPVSRLSLTSSPAVRENIDTDVEIKCSVNKATSAFSRFAVTWLVQQQQQQQQAETKTILSSDYAAVETSGPQGESSHGQRISMRRSKGPSFELTLRQVRIGDSGLYFCKVVEWLQDPRGQWYELPAVNTTTQLHAIEPQSNLSIKQNVKLNVSRSQHFSIPCHIMTQPSRSSAFQVTWFWQKETGTERLPIFIFYRNSTLEDRGGRGERLRFDHPVPGYFNLTVLEPGLADGGVYFCEVEEWLLSVSQGWRKAAVEKSGDLTVSVYAEARDTDAVSDPGASSGIVLGALAGIIVCLLIVVILLVVKIRRGLTSGAKKRDNSLWAEEHPLTPKDSAED